MGSFCRTRCTDWMGSVRCKAACSSGRHRRHCEARSGEAYDSTRTLVRSGSESFRAIQQALAFSRRLHSAPPSAPVRPELVEGPVRCSGSVRGAEDRWPGVARRLVTFLVSPRKVTKRKRPRHPRNPGNRAHRTGGEELAPPSMFLIGFLWAGLKHLRR